MEAEKHAKTILEPREGAKTLLALIIYGLILEVLLWLALRLLHIDYTRSAKVVTVSVGYVLALAVLYRRFLKESFQDMGREPERFWKGFLLGCIVFFLPLALLEGLTAALPEGMIGTPNEDYLDALAAENHWPMVLNSVLFAPVREEMIYRAILFATFRKDHRVRGYVVTVLTFAAAHIVLYLKGMSLVTFLFNFCFYGMAGFALCFAYEASGNIFAPMLIHILNNLLVQMMK